MVNGMPVFIPETGMKFQIKNLSETAKRSLGNLPIRVIAAVSDREIPVQMASFMEEVPI